MAVTIKGFASDWSVPDPAKAKLDALYDKVDPQGRQPVRRGELFLNVKDFGAVGDGAADDTVAINAAITAASTPGPANPLPTSARSGGIVWFPPGYYRITSGLVVNANSVILRGAGRTATHINAAWTFPVSTPMVTITNETVGTVFGSRIESMTLNCNGIAGSVGMLTTTGQEGVGLYDTRVRDFKDAGLRIKNMGTQDPAAEIYVDLSEFWGASNGSNYGIDVDAAVGAVYIDRSTMRPVVYDQGTHLAAVRNKNAQVAAHNLHIEQYNDGILTVTGGRTIASQIKGYNGTGATATTALINVANDNSSGVFEAIYNGTGNTFYAPRYSRLSPSGYINRISVAPSGLSSFYKTDSVMGQLELRGYDPALPLLVARNTQATGAHQVLAQFEDSAGNVGATISANGYIMGRNVRLTGVSTKTGNYTAGQSDAIILVSGTNTQTLPPATVGQTSIYKNIGAGTVTIQPASGTIDGAANVTLTSQYQSVKLVSDGTNWFVI